jgi:hypothetical protein
MTAMRRVTMLMPDELWTEMATAASIRAQSRGVFARSVLARETNGILISAGLKDETDPAVLAHQARRKAEREAAETQLAQEGGE